MSGDFDCTLGLENPGPIICFWLQNTFIQNFSILFIIIVIAYSKYIPPITWVDYSSSDTFPLFHPLKSHSGEDWGTMTGTD